MEDGLRRTTTSDGRLVVKAAPIIFFVFIQVKRRGLHLLSHFRELHALRQRHDVPDKRDRCLRNANNVVQSRHRDLTVSERVWCSCPAATFETSDELSAQRRCICLRRLRLIWGAHSRHIWEESWRRRFHAAAVVLHSRRHSCG